MEEKVFGRILEPNFMLVVMIVSIGLLFILNFIRFNRLSKHS